jgi:hypothetical protein
MQGELMARLFTSRPLSPTNILDSDGMIRGTHRYSNNLPNGSLNTNGMVLFGQSLGSSLSAARLLLRPSSDVPIGRKGNGVDHG